MNKNHKLPYTLALDTSTPWLTLALGNCTEIIYQHCSQVIEDHSRVLIQSLEEMQKKNLFLTFPPEQIVIGRGPCLLYTSPSPRDRTRARMPSSA